MIKAKILIESDSITSTEVHPVWKGDFTYDRERDQVFYRHKIDSEMVFKGNDFTLINDAPECEVITVTVQRYCGGDWADYWQGTFTKYDCKFDIDRCELRVKPEVSDKYTCILGDWNTEYNIYGGTAIQVRSFHGDYEAGLHCCADTQPTPDPCGDWTDSCLEWSIAIPVGDFGGGWAVKSCWHRVVGVGTPTTPPPYGDPGDWTHLSGNDWWRCPDETEINLGVMRWGRVFNNVLEGLLDNTGCSLTVRSHFFNINATHEPAPPDNAAYTFAEANLQKMTLHQKSDVKRPDTSDPSQLKVWVMKPKDMLDDLRTMFNVFWEIRGTDLVIEHASYFDTLTGADYSDQKIRTEYDADTDGAPQKELFKWSDDVILSTAHSGYPIEYDCGEGEKENRVKNFTNDLASINDTSNAEFIADRGFVLVSNAVYGGVYAVLDSNNALGWVALHDNLHRHGRYFLEGRMNDEDTTFTTAKRVKKLTSFTVQSCCEDDFDPVATITVPAGVGEVKRAGENIFRESLKIDLLI